MGAVTKLTAPAVGKVRVSKHGRRRTRSERWRLVVLDSSPEVPEQDLPKEQTNLERPSRSLRCFHEDGTARAQVVTEDTNPVYYKLIQELEKHTGNAVVLNTSLNRRGEPMICSPTDALNMFYGCDLQYLMLENVLVKKPGVE